MRGIKPAMLVYGAIALCAVLGVLVGRADAQLAPTGDHYAARPSDTGTVSGAVTPSGSYALGVPLSLPPARGGIPIPLSLLYGTHGVGAAGVAWDVPLSFVRRDTTLAHRKPRFENKAGAAPTVRDRYTVTIEGQRLDLVPKTINGLAFFVAQHGSTEIRLRQLADHWVLYDGNGLTYSFTLLPKIPATSGLWFLTRIDGPDGAALRLDYDARAVVYRGVTTYAIDLRSVQYNPYPGSSTCFKHRVDLAYSDDQSPALSLATVNNLVLARFRTLKTIAVAASATCGSPTVLRTYKLMYDQPDLDTSQPRLGSVTMSGQAGTTEAGVNLPVGAYRYGSVSDGAKVTWQSSQQIVLKSNVDASLASLVVGSPWSNPMAQEQHSIWQTLIDVNGDGRPDLVSRGTGGDWNVQVNWPDVGGGTRFSDPVQLTDSTLRGTDPFEKLGISGPRYGKGITDPGRLRENGLWRQAIDVNGDGRIDIIDAAELEGAWVVYLNTNGQSSLTTWKRRIVDVRNVAAALRARGFLTLGGNFVPLALHQSGRSFDWSPVTNPPEYNFHEYTYTAWELKDVNGDGFPDLVMNDGTTTYKEFDDAAGNHHGRFTRQGHHVDVMINIAGMRLASAPPDYLLFHEPTRLLNDANCGVEQWVSDTLKPEQQELDCTFADVNGDGLVDRIEGIGVRLGNGIFAGLVDGADASFTPMLIELPGIYSVHLNDAHLCNAASAGPNTTFNAGTIAGMRDVNGDGIPDYITETTVQFGTGTGFGPPLTANVGDLSAESERCDGGVSSTSRGLYDIDGDGKPDKLVIDKSGAHPVIQVWRLASPAIQVNHVAPSAAEGAARAEGTDIEISRAGLPEAGHLIAVDNGFGASTRISYRSAKEDTVGGPNTHAVPFPEIVVSSVATLGSGSVPLLTRTSYAYGGASLVFDSAHQRWHMPAYARTVALHSEPSAGVPGAQPLQQAPPRQYTAVLTDTVVQDPWHTSAPLLADKYAREQLPGRVRDVTTLAGTGIVDPWSLLYIDATTAPGAIGAVHSDWQVRAFKEPRMEPDFTENECFDWLDPYDWDRTLVDNLCDVRVCRYDVCSDHGLAYEATMTTWRGAQAPPSRANVQTRTDIQVDDLGRTTLADYSNDVTSGNDDYCVSTTYAEARGNGPRVLNAPATTALTSCLKNGVGTIYAQAKDFYDGLPNGVTSGHLTSSIVEHHATDTGIIVGQRFRPFVATYDAQGNLRSVTETREQRVTRTTTIDHDAFGLVPTHVHITATNAAAQDVTSDVDPVTLAVRSVTDTTGTTAGTIYDGFGRPIYTTVKPVGGTVGVLSQTLYLGFQGGDPAGRRVVRKILTDPVPQATVDATPGRSATSFLDQLGRVRRTEVALGSDYGNETLVVGARIYDLLGRVAFAADPYPASQNAASAYGTTRYFRSDGSLYASVRGAGPQPVVLTTDQAKDVFPTLYSHGFADGRETYSIQAADALTIGAPQAGVARSAILSATGRILSRQTRQGAALLEEVDFGYDRLGQLTSATRYVGPTAVAALVTTWRRDSIGHVLEMQDPGSPSQKRTYNQWGDLTHVDWSAPGEPRRGIAYNYDGLSRLTHAEEQNDGATDLATVNDYTYDVGVAVSHEVVPSNVLGRLASARSPTGSVAFSYDGFGRQSAQSFTDPSARYYVQKAVFHGDGSLSAMELDLPDNGHTPETVTYAYDTAGQLRTMAAGTSTLYRATSIDAWGRVRAASLLGGTTYAADYDDTGRRLFKSSTVRSASGYRTIVNGSGPTLANGVQYPYDAVGRLNIRQESKSATVSGPITHYSYDALGRVSGMLQTDPRGTTTLAKRSFSYDMLGDVTRLADPIGASTATIGWPLTPNGGIGEVPCQIAYGSNSANGTSCNVTVDGAGNTTSMPTRNGTRQLTWFNAGWPRTVMDSSGATATFAYDPFGRVQELTVAGGASPDKRHDRRYGDLLTWHDGPGGTPFLTRSFPGPVDVSRRGATGPWVLAFGEARGARFMTNQSGAFVEDVDYAPYGEAAASGQQPPSPSYTSEQWNGGDNLAALGLVHLGARLYDPVIGRFLSRDPLATAATGSTSNPYAFANGDPINRSDPTGLGAEGEDDSGPLDDWGWYPGGYNTPNPLSGPQSHPASSAPVYTDTTSVSPVVIEAAHTQAEFNAYAAMRAEEVRDAGRTALHQIARANAFTQSHLATEQAAKMAAVSPLEMAGRVVANEAVDTVESVIDTGVAGYHSSRLLIREIAGGTVTEAEAWQNLKDNNDAHARFELRVLTYAGPLTFVKGGAAAASAGLDAIETTTALVEAEDALVAVRGTANSADLEVAISRSRFGEAAAHAEDWITTFGQDTFTVDRVGMAERRAASLDGVPRIRGFDRDEFPMAVMREGGGGASVRHIDPHSNRSLGSWLGRHQFAGLANGQTVRLTFVPRRLKLQHHRRDTSHRAVFQIRRSCPACKVQPHQIR